MVNRICHITTVHPRFDIRIFQKECRSLASEFEVFLIVADGKGDEVVDGIYIQDVGIGKNSRLARMLTATRKAYKKAIELNCSIYHFHDPEFLFFALKLVKKGKKVIYDVHEDVPKQILSKSYIYPVLRRSLAGIIAIVERYISGRLTSVITVTKSINIRFLSTNKNSIIINNYPIISEAGISPDYNTREGICYIGNISPVRGIRELLSALDFTDCVLNMAGEFESDSFKKELHSHRNWGKVKYFGVLKPSKAFEIIEKSLIGIVTYLPEPNHLEAQPNKMFEYMSAGIPVIASNFALWKAIIEGNNCGICIDPSDTDEISKSINYLLHNKDLSKMMGENGRRSVIERYNWNSEKDKLIKLYKSLV